MKVSPQNSDTSRATLLQKVVFVLSLGALFLVAVGAEGPGEASCCPEDECVIVFNPGAPAFDLNVARSVEVRLFCKGEERSATFRVSSFDSLLLQSAVINTVFCGQGKVAPCVDVFVKAADQFSENDIFQLNSREPMSQSHPLEWFFCVQKAGIVSDDPLDFLFLQGNDAVIQVQTEVTDDEGKQRTVTGSLIVSVNLESLRGSAVAVEVPLGAGIETTP